MKCDLHIHTNCSDGIYTPEQIITMAKERGLDCVAITDHDTVIGVRRAKAKAAEVGIGYLVGVELSCVADTEVHVLGYNLDIDADGFDDAIEKIANLRDARNKAMVEKLKQHGFEIDLEKLKKNGSVGRGSIAREMVSLGYCQSVTEVFENYLGVDKCCYVQSRRLTPQEAIKFVLQFGGIPVLAHPKQLHQTPKQFEAFLKELVSCGLAGIESDYFAHNNYERKFFGKMAKKYKLIVTGGSDFHDYTHGIELGLQSASPNAFTRKVLGI